MTEMGTRQNLPFVTIVMPIRNEAAYIERSLGAILAQDHPSERMEVLVADGMSDDGTREIVRQLATRYSQVAIQVFDNPGRIVATGLNATLRQARGDVVVWVSGHCEIAPDYVRRCVHYLLHDGFECVGGPIETVGETFLSQAIAKGMSSQFGVGDSAFRTVNNRTMLVDAVAFPAFTRQTIERCGPFDEELVRNQDDEYSYRLRKLGGRILLASDVRSRYYSRTSFRALWHQHFWSGLWKVRVLQKHPRQMRLRQFVPLAFVAALFGSAVLVPFTRIGILFLVGVGGSYALANLIASLWTARKGDLRYLLLLPAVFATIHFSYGLGFLLGLVRFAGRWWDR